MKDGRSSTLFTCWFPFLARLFTCGFPFLAPIVPLSYSLEERVTKREDKCWFVLMLINVIPSSKVASFYRLIFKRFKYRFFLNHTDVSYKSGALRWTLATRLLINSKCLEHPAVIRTPFPPPRDSSPPALESADIIINSLII